MYEMNIVNGMWGENNENKNINNSINNKDNKKGDVNSLKEINFSKKSNITVKSDIFEPIKHKQEISDEQRREDAYKEALKEEVEFLNKNNIISYEFEPLKDPTIKYGMRKSFKPNLENRLWIDKEITHAPKWCSVDLRDGNQALKNPMTLGQKLIHWKALIGLGFKEIEIGFPAASRVDYDFTRVLIEKGLIPDDVTIQVLSQARKEQIEKTFEAIKGAKRAIVHLYNSTSELQRRIVFQKEEDEIIELIVNAVEELKYQASKTDTEIIFEYSPESFSRTEPEFAVRICNAVIEAWGPTKDRKMIINLPQTVEMASPDVFADQVEYFMTHINHREALEISIHPHNDMGMAVAAATSALKAGVDRVEGTIFGNGERTGNLNIANLALNLMSMGIEPNLNFSDLDTLIKIYKYCTNMSIDSRAPYIGSEVFTARSGSHQDAIAKSFRYMEQNPTGVWEATYLHVDPSDIGRKYEAIEINSQSGKGGVSFKISNILGFDMPRDMQIEFSKVVQKCCDDKGVAIDDKIIKRLFKTKYKKENPFFSFSNIKVNQTDCGVEASFKIAFEGKEYDIKGKGGLELEAVKNALESINTFPYKIEVIGNKHRINSDNEIELLSFVKITHNKTQEYFCGIGTGINIKNANINAVFSAINNMKS